MKKYFLLMNALFAFFGCTMENKLDVQIDEDLDLYDIEIELKVPHYLSNTVIYKNGEKNKIPNVYGENDWKITYRDSLSATFRHLKTNRNDIHKYAFKVYRKGESLFVYVNIKGDSEFLDTLELRSN